MDGNKKITGIVFAAITALAINACKVQPPVYVGLYIDNLTSVNDTINPGEAPLKMVDTAMIQVVNTTSVIEAEMPVYLRAAEEIVKLSSDSVYQLEVEKLRKSIIDSIQLLGFQINKLRKQLTVMPDTSFYGERPQQFQPQDSLQTEYPDQQQLRAMDEQIQTLKNRLNSMQNAVARTPHQTTVTSEPAKVQFLGNQQNNQLSLQIFQDQNDTIKLLRRQLRNLQLKPYKSDSVYIENEAKELQLTNELFHGQKTSELQPLHDTVPMLKNRVQSLEETTSPDKETSALDIQVKRDVSYKAISDTIVAFYEQGRIKPIEEESVLKQIKDLCSNKNVLKITLSGFTDSSGNEKVNKAITNKRLTYLSENIIPWISEEKIYFQNFGDVFSSDTLVNDERRIEIRIYTK